MTDNSRRDFLRKVTAGSAALAAGTITSYASNEMTGHVRALHYNYVEASA